MSTQEVSVSLATNVLTVTGTVNGVEYAWTRNGDTWTATVARADDGKYVVVLTIVDTQGRTSTAEITLYYGLNLVRDRTAADVARVRYLLGRFFAGSATAEERTEFLDPALKGAYNATDLNRVGAAVQYLRDRLYTLAGEVVIVTAKSDWTESDIPTEGDMEAYLADIAAIRGALDVPETVPQVPEDMVNLTHTEANDIEQILWDVNEFIMRVLASWRYAGELYAGEV